MKRCFGERFNVSVMIDGRVVKGEITVKTGEPPQNCRMSLTPIHWRNTAGQVLLKVVLQDGKLYKMSVVQNRIAAEYESVQ